MCFWPKNPARKPFRSVLPMFTHLYRKYFIIQLPFRGQQDKKIRHEGVHGWENAVERAGCL